MHPLELALFTLAREYTDSDPKLEERLLRLATIAAYDYVESPEITQRRKENPEYKSAAEKLVEQER